jgi:hypothetical protein
VGDRPSRDLRNAADAVAVGFFVFVTKWCSGDDNIAGADDDDDDAAGVGLGAGVDKLVIAGTGADDEDEDDEVCVEDDELYLALKSAGASLHARFSAGESATASSALRFVAAFSILLSCARGLKSI